MLPFMQMIVVADIDFSLIDSEREKMQIAKVSSKSNFFKKKKKKKKPWLINRASKFIIKGLEIEKDGEWILCELLPNSFVILAGDALMEFHSLSFNERKIHSQE